MEDDDKYTRITLRIPKDIHRTLGAEADRTSKSLNAEIVARLQQSFESQEDAELVEMKHFFESQNTERNLLRETGRHLQKIIDAQDVNLIVLSTYLVDVINALPAKMRNQDRIKAAAQFVMGMGQGTESQPSQQAMLPLEAQRTVETVKAVVRGKKVDTGIVAPASPDGSTKPR